MGRSSDPAGPWPSLRPVTHYRRLGTERGLIWTRLREEVLALLWESRGLWGPYDITTALRQAGFSTHANSIYRSLDRLEQAGLIIRLAVRKRYVISPDPEISAWGVFLCAFCEACIVEPLGEAHAQARSLAREQGFRARAITIECLGRCPRCG